MFNWFKKKTTQQSPELPLFIIKYDVEKYELRAGFVVLELIDQEYKHIYSYNRYPVDKLYNGGKYHYNSIEEAKKALDYYLELKNMTIRIYKDDLLVRDILK